MKNYLTRKKSATTRVMIEKVNLKNSKGDRLVGILSNPTNRVDSPILVMAHGFTSSKDTRKYVVLEKLLNDVSIATLRFDFYGHGESDGDFKDITVSEAVDDILSAIQWVSDKGFSNIHVVGNSFGGAAAILATAQSHEVCSLLLIAPVPDYATRDGMTKSAEEMVQWHTQGFRLYTSAGGRVLPVNYTFVEDYKKLDGIAAAQKITVPVCIIHGTEDESVPLVLSTQLSEHIQNSTLTIIDGANHRFIQKKHFEEMITTAVNFLKTVCLDEKNIKS